MFGELAQQKDAKAVQEKLKDERLCLTVAFHEHTEQLHTVNNRRWSMLKSFANSPFWNSEENGELMVHVQYVEWNDAQTDAEPYSFTRAYTSKNGGRFISLRYSGSGAETKSGRTEKGRKRKVKGKGKGKGKRRGRREF